MVVSAVMWKLTWVHERTSLSFVYTFVSSRKHHLIFLSPAYLLYNHSLWCKFYVWYSLKLWGWACIHYFWATAHPFYWSLSPFPLTCALKVHFWNLKKCVTKNTIFSPDIRFDGRKTVLHTPWTSGLYKV